MPATGWLDPLVAAWNASNPNVKVSTQTWDQIKSGPQLTQPNYGPTYASATPSSSAGTGKSMATTTNSAWDSLSSALSNFSNPQPSTSTEPKPPNPAGMNAALSQFRKLSANPNDPLWQSNPEYAKAINAIGGKANANNASTQYQNQWGNVWDQVGKGNESAVMQALNIVRQGQPKQSEEQKALQKKYDEFNQGFKSQSDMHLLKRGDAKAYYESTGLKGDALDKQLAAWDKANPAPVQGQFDPSLYQQLQLQDQKYSTGSQVYEDAKRALDGYFSQFGGGTLFGSSGAPAGTVDGSAIEAAGGGAGGTGTGTGAGGTGTGGASGSSDPYAGGAYGSAGGVGQTAQVRPMGDNMYSTSIDVNNIWSPQAVNERVNQTNAQIAAAAARNAQELGNTLSNRGMGNGSGLSAALQAQLQANAAAKAAESENNLRWGASQGNAQQILSAQQARSSEGLGLANLLQQGQLANQNQNNAMQQSILSALLQAMLSG